MNEENTLKTPWSEEVISSGPVPDKEAPYAGFWSRCVAFLIDVIISAVPPALICFPVIFWLVKKGVEAEQMGADAAGYSVGILVAYLVWNVLGALSFWLYFSWQESSKHQATWGKRLFKIKVVNKEGASLGFAHATGRTLAKIASYVTLYIGFLMAPFSNRKRALHDFIAETYVVKADFQQEDSLPDTHSRWGIFAIIVAVLALLGATLLLHMAKQTANPTALKAKIAVSVLPGIAQQGGITEPVTQSEITFFQDETGYRALFQDETGESYVLYLPEPNGTVCCDIFPNEDCQNISVPVCQ
ncbi:MAG: RDD family protein [Elusimicrobiaceae bacterium]|nr:RDD family protein [Elusimicrobiaceae bacterium]